mgnify:CR=1 FL=1
MEKKPSDAIAKTIADIVFVAVRLFCFPFVVMVLAKELLNIDWSDKYWYLVLAIYTAGILTKEN